jgi:Tfp pilus assembly PilM family ATPase
MKRKIVLIREEVEKFIQERNITMEQFIESIKKIYKIDEEDITWTEFQ